ncbi:polysaccharide deacetylase family protein [Paenibacillus sp. PAMC21692]|uniref:polysaccharide deacetylase family protein n=1 Tax=Paenibacillus sp. PAMC21692 TaxID=2762320 RepID=UPI00164E70D8|nr:polysaccharide deacetylase family protein [Paenibacillus sp. PAMC21692]QNK56651.1 polysaccharide deacetylase [Paenibacillus sp. PAMC21692]
MRRVVQASLCVTILWFGVMQLDGGLGWQGKAAGAASNVGDLRTVTYQYEAKTLLAKPDGKAGEAPSPNDRDGHTAETTNLEKVKAGAAGGGNDETQPEMEGISTVASGESVDRTTHDGAHQGGADKAKSADGGANGGKVTVESNNDGANGGKGTAESTSDGTSSDKGTIKSASDGANGGKGTVASTSDGANSGVETAKSTNDGSVGVEESGQTSRGTKTDGTGTVTAQDVPASKQPEKIVYLTFDDGPSKHTPEVLSILKREGVTATFFLLGQQVERQPDMVKQIVAEGHAIGNHTYNHVYRELYGGFRNFADQIMRTDDAIFQAAGIRTTLVRAPGGTYANFDQGYFDAMKAAGYKVHDWNVDSGDSKRVGVPASEIIANIRASKIANTLNVLMHDSGGHAETVKALPSIIAYYKQLGYSFAALSDGVDPMQFKVASQSKWSRGSVTESDKQSLAAFASRLDRKGGIKKQAEPALIIHRGEKSLELQASEYTLQNGTIRVPLTKLSEWLGGKAELDEKEGVIEVTLDGRQWFWLTDQASSGQGNEAKLDVPIRATLAQFGMEIEDYVLTKERREIWIGQ